MECSICYDTIDSTTGVATLSCSHSFHISCITGWFVKLEKGTCPCCRKEMSPLEDLHQTTYAEGESESEDDDDDDEDDEDDEEDEEDEEVEFSRTELDALLRARGGNGLTDAMAAQVCPEFGMFMLNELNALIIGNGGHPLGEEQWNRLQWNDDRRCDWNELQGNDEDAIAAAVATVWNELASYDAEPRSQLMIDGSWASNILNPEDATDVSVVAPTESAAMVASNAAIKVQAVWRGFRGRLSTRM